MRLYRDLEREQDAERHRGAIRSQGGIRGGKARANLPAAAYEEAQEEEDERGTSVGASQRIQAGFRGAQCRKEVGGRHYGELLASAGVLQASLSAREARRGVADEYQQGVMEATRSVQGGLRGRSARRQVDSILTQVREEERLVAGQMLDRQVYYRPPIDKYSYIYYITARLPPDK